MSNCRTPCLAPPKLLLMSDLQHNLGKSYLLTTVYLWALIRKMKVKAAAPTGNFTLTCIFFGIPNPNTGLETTRVYVQGIAAANIEVENTDIAATTKTQPFSTEKTKK